PNASVPTRSSTTGYNSLHRSFHKNSQLAVGAQSDRYSAGPHRPLAHEPRDRCRQWHAGCGGDGDEAVGSLAADSAVARVGRGCGWTSGDGLSTASGAGFAASGDVNAVTEGHNFR